MIPLRAYLCLALLLTWACAPQRQWIDSWPAYQYNAAHTGFVPDGPLPPLEPAWAVATEGRIVNPPVIQDGILYLGSRDGKLYALDCLTGAQRWQFDIGQGGIHQSPVVIGDLLYAGKWTPYYFVYALDRLSGEVLWSHQSGELLNREPWVVADAEMAYFNADPPPDIDAPLSVMTAVSHDTHQIQWRQPVAGRLYAAPALSEELLLVPASDPDALHALDKKSGQPRWSFATEAALRSAPLIAGDRVYLANEAGYLHALDLATGKLLWRYQFPGVSFRSDMALADNRLLIPGDPRNLYTFELGNLEAGWVYRSARKLAAPIATPHHIYVGSEDKTFYVLDLLKGKAVWQYRSGGEILSSAAIYQDKVIFGAGDGRIYAFQEAKKD